MENLCERLDKLALYDQDVDFIDVTILPVEGHDSEDEEAIEVVNEPMEDQTVEQDLYPTPPSYEEFIEEIDELMGDDLLQPQAPAGIQYALEHDLTFSIDRSPSYSIIGGLSEGAKMGASEADRIASIPCLQRASGSSAGR